MLVSRRERDLGKVISGCMRKRKVTHWSGSHCAMKSRGGVGGIAQEGLVTLLKDKAKVISGYMQKKMLRTGRDRTAR